MDISQDTVLGAIVAVALFLAGSATKYALDRTLWPKLSDVWSRRNRRRALEKAESLRDQYIIDLRSFSDARLMTAEVALLQVRVAGYATMSIAILLLAMFIVAAGMFFKERWATVFGFASMIAGMLLLLLTPFMNDNVKKFRDMEVYWYTTASRVRALLVAAGTPEQDIEVFLKSIAQPPAL